MFSEYSERSERFLAERAMPINDYSRLTITTRQKAVPGFQGKEYEYISF